MSNDQAKGRRVSRSYLTHTLRVVLACILVLVAIWPVGVQPQATQAAPPPPTSIATPTPQPTEPGLSAQGATPPSPDKLPPEVEQARARQAMGAALAKYLRYWGPRYQVAPVEVAVEDEWAHGVAQWQSATKTLSGPIHILARRLPDGTWQALMPGSDGLYRQWVEAVPESLVPAGEKSQLRTQAAEADAVRRPQATPAVPPTPTARLPGKEGPGEPAEPVTGLVQPTATPTPQLSRLTQGLRYVYARDGNIWATDEAGQSHSQLTSGGHDSAPVLSPDGRFVAYLSVLPQHLGSAPTPQHICVVDIVTGNSSCLTDEPALRGSPVWNHDGTRLAYVEGRHLVVVSVDGDGRSIVATNVAFDGPSSAIPAWSPDGSILACMLADNDGPAIWIINFNTESRHLLMRLEHTISMPIKFSPDGSLITVVDPYDEGRLWAIPLDGSEPARISDPATMVYSFAWSPSGERIAYSTINGSVWILDLRTGTSREVSKGEAQDPPPEVNWGDGGEDILLTTSTIGGTNLTILSLADRQKFSLTPAIAIEEQVAAQDFLLPLGDITAPFEWYRYQGEWDSGSCDYNNCGPTSVAMSIQFANDNQWVAISDIRSYISGSNCRWTNLNDLRSALSHWGVDHTIITGMDAVRDAVNNRGHIVIVPVWMSYIPPSESDYQSPSSNPANHYNRYYSYDSGHILVVKGISSDNSWVIVYDPNVWEDGNGVYWYSDSSAKGRSRYYNYSSFTTAFANNGNQAIEILEIPGGDTCSAPSLNSPNDGYVHTSSDRTITFRWDPPSTCPGLDVYTFRVVDDPNKIDSGPWIKDHGIDAPGTSTTEAFDRDDDFWWAVWPCRGCKSGSPNYGERSTMWHFRITSVPTPLPTPPPGNWQVTYYNDTNLGSQCNTASVDGVYVFQDWGDDTPTSGCNADNWSARFSRQVHFQSGEYTFGLGSDDWGRIRVGNDTVVDNWQGADQHYESRVLSEGNYDVTVEFADTLGAARLAAWWWGPGFDVPRQSQDPSQWYAQYWGNKDLWWDSIVRVNEGTGRLAHSWDTGGPGYGLPNDRFSSRFERRVYFDCGRYRFHIFTDDGVRFWIDDQQRLDRWSDSVNGYDVYVDLSAGYHDLRLEHYENDGSAAISLDWFMESGCVPNAPSNLSATAVSPSQINLTWTDNSNTETGFRIYRNGSYIGQVGANITSYQDTGLTCGTSYSYYVRAYNSAGESEPSNTSDTHTQCIPSLPDLRPYAPSGYTYQVVPSSVQGTHEVNTLYAGRPTYFDWHFINSGDVTASGDFHVELWVGDTRYMRYPYSDFSPGQFDGFDDWMETITTPGWHTVRLVTDPDDTVTESDETNNVWERQFYWIPIAPYADDMESGTNDWTATGLWHQVDRDSPYPESHSGSHSWWYGQDATGDYDTGSANSGDLASPPIYIPTSGYYLRFWYWYETETQGPDWDQRWVQISVDGGPFNNVLQLFDDPMNRWLQSPVIELSGYAGHTIQVRFRFSTLDGAYNSYRGWYIDDLDISTTPPPPCADSHEPNDTASQATAIAYGQTINADICPGGDYDYYQFIGTAGDRVVVDIDAEVNGSLLDSYVFLLDSNGMSVLAEHNDEIPDEVQDSHLGYQLPHDGTYYIKVRAWDHPSAGGTDYFYAIHLLTDDTNPSSAEVTSPGNSAWLDPSLETITASASDNESGIRRVEFLWHDADWQNSAWVWLGADQDSRDGWSWDFDTSGLAEQRGGAFDIRAFDWAGNWTGASVWNLGIDRTPPTVGVGISPMYDDAPFLDFYVWWWGSDNLSDTASYDIQYRDGPGGTWTNLLTGTTDTYHRFVGEDGRTYYFHARARDQAGNQSAYSADVQHMVQICHIAADAYELDNSYTAAKTITTDGTHQSHNFHALGDQDWVTFTGTAGIVYTLVTTNTGGHADTVLYLYKSDGNTLIDSNDDDPDNWPASRLEWGATSGGTYYVKVEHWDSYAYGCTTVYDLSIVETGTLPVYLPLIFKAAGPPMPDLVVDSLVATSDTVRVTIKNQGNVPVTDEFWVDVYFNPTETPRVNKPWDTIASHGVVWGVTTPIPANGGSLTLITGDEYYFPDLSSPAPLPAGANVYALVDSINYDTAYGVVLESNEDNNLFGPVTSTAGVMGEAAPVGNQGQSPSREGLPPRR